MIQFETEYYEFIIKNGVGSNDKVASSPKSYISYLTSVSRLLGKDISPKMLSKDEDVDLVASVLKGLKKPNTIRNYKSAMRQYVQMVKLENLNGNCN